MSTAVQSRGTPGATRAAATSLAVPIRESVYNAAPVRVDRDAGVIFGVKVVGRESPNCHGMRGATRGTRYTPEALTKAAPLYEGLMVNVDHPPRANPGADRSALDRVGKLVNVREEADGLYADLRLLKTHPMAERLMEAAESMPDAFGLSHNALGRGEVRGGWYVIEDIPDVRSVDVVADAGTVKSLFESKKLMSTFRQLVEAKGQKALGRCQGLKALLELEDYGSMPMPEDAGSDAGAGDHKQDLVNALTKLMNSDDPDDVAKFDAIVKLLRPDAQAADGDSDAAGDADSGAAATADVEEGCDPAMKDRKDMKAMESELRVLRLEKGVRQLCESLQFAPTQLQIDALAGLDSDEKRKAHVADLKELRELKESRQARPTAPRSQAPAGPGAADPSYPKALERLTGRQPAGAQK